MLGFGDSKSRASRAGGSVDTLIGPQMVLRGDIQFSGGLYLEGQLIGRAIVLDAAGAERGWAEHEVPLSAHFRAAYGIAPTGFVTEIAISADADDTGAAIEARLSDLRFKPCNPSPRSLR